MRKNQKRDALGARHVATSSRFHSSVENFKRRRALPSVSTETDDFDFFERVLSVKKIREFVFITRAAAKNC